LRRGSRKAVSAWFRDAGRQRPADDINREQGGGPLLDEVTLRQLTRMRIAGSQSFTDWLEGEHPGRRKMQSLEFEDYRPYAPGDDFRQIDWNAYARLGDLFVKTSLAEETMSIALVIDCSKSMQWGRPTKLRYALQLAAAVGALALLHGDRVRVFGIGEARAMAGIQHYGPAALTPLTDDLAQLPVVQTTELGAAIAAYLQIAEPRGAVLLFSDLLAPIDDIHSLEMLATPGRYAVVVQVIDPLEAAPDLRGVVALRDSETGATSTVSMTPAVRALYGKRFQERAAAIQASLATAAVRYVAASTNVPPLDLLAGPLRGQGIVHDS
jgi:uncharacterized protein (DUF58 family)